MYAYMRTGNSKRKLPCLTTEQVLTNSLKDQQLKKSNMSKNLSNYYQYFKEHLQT